MHLRRCIASVVADGLRNSLVPEVAPPPRAIVSNSHAQVALTGLRVSDSVEECGCIDYCTYAAQFMGAKLGAANYYADDGLWDERPPGGSAQGSNPEHQSRSEYCGHYAQRDRARRVGWRFDDQPSLPLFSAEDDSHSSGGSFGGDAAAADSGGGRSALFCSAG